MATEEGLRDLLATARGESPSGGEPEYVPGHVVPKGRHMASEETLQEVISAISGGGSGTAIDLGITGAAVGEVAAVASVDVDGKPTAWEAVTSGPVGVTATLLANAWSNNAQTVGVTGITTTSLVVAAPAPECVAAWSDNGIYCASQSEGTLTFSCSNVPDSDLVVNVMIF